MLSHCCRAVLNSGVVAVLILAVGCGGGGEPTGAPTGQVLAPSGGSDGVVVTFGTEPSPPAKGDNQLVVTVAKSDGSAVTDGTVTAVFAMPAMPSMNMPALRTETALTHAGEGRYQGTGQLSMSGTWEVAITVRQGAQELATRRTSVVARE